MIKDMTKQEFLEKWKMPEFMIETNTDFKMMLLSNISSIQECGDISKDDISKLDTIKEFIMDFYNVLIFLYKIIFRSNNSFITKRELLSFIKDSNIINSIYKWTIIPEDA